MDIDITNPYNDTVQYGVTYSLISPTNLPEDVTIAESSLSKSSATGSIEANETKSISLVIVNNSTESLTVSFSVINGYKNGGELIVGTEKLIEDVYNIVPLSLITLMNLGLDDDIQTDTPDFSKVSYSTCDTSTDTTCEATVGIYSMKDDLGTSYYFRGDVENNYVYFANSYWRIIRINGDGSVRMIYDGTSAHTNGEESEDRIVASMDYALYSRYNDNTYVGYMYGTAGVTGTGEDGYNQTHSNEHDNTIKTYLEDTWYPTLSDNDKMKIADAIYCNDRSLDTSNASYTGIGYTETYYAGYQRLIRNSIPSPILKCLNKNDRFTYNASIGSVEENNKLEAAVGLITADEVILAGASVKAENKKIIYI